MRLTLLLTSLLIAPLSCKSSGSGQRESDSSLASESAANVSSNVVLGLNDVAILIPHTFNVKFVSKVPGPFDKPDPAKFAPGTEALPLDNKNFIPSEVLKGLADELAKDTAVLTREQRSQLGYTIDKSDPAGNEIEMKDAAVAKLDQTNPNEFKLIALRIDPCSNYPVLKKVTGECAHEVRLTWQKVKAAKSFSALPDSFLSVHTLDELTFKRFVAGLRSLRAKAGPSDPQEPLSPHPVIRAEGPDSPFLAGVVALVHRYIRASNLTNVMFHHQAAASMFRPWTKHWSFTAVNVKNGQPQHVDLPLLAQQNPKRLAQRHAVHIESKWQEFVDHEQAWRAAAGMFDDRLEPSPVWEGKGSLFEEKSGTDGGESAIVSKHKNAFLIQNPMLHHLKNTDCASCHLAAFAQDKNRILIESQNPAKRAERLKQPDGAFKSNTWNIEAAALDRGFYGTSRSGQVDSMQMFGYFQDEWVVMYNVINESAISADLVKNF